MRTLARPLCLLPLLACTAQTELTRAEAKEVIEESVSAARGEATTTEVIEITTSFTLGAAAEEAAEELRAWWASQVPCATITREGATLTVDFGDLSDDCAYEGRTYGGVASVTVDRTDEEDVALSWSFDALTNGSVSVSGAADVTWAGGENPSRHVVHELRWDREDGLIEASGDRLQTLLDPEQGLAGGIRIDGVRAWDAPSGAWDLDIDGVEARPADPVPQAGVYTLLTPSGKSASLSFARVDEDTIEVTLSGVRGGDRVYHVTSAGEVSEG